MAVHFGRDITGNLETAEEREFLVTNGIGGYCSGTVAGSLTRGYHGLLVSSLKPPIDRRLMLAKLEETITYRGTAFALTSNRWQNGAVAPEGYKNIQTFALESSIPTWQYACADALIEKKVWMKYGENTTYVSYEVLEADEVVELQISAIVDNRIFHNTGQVEWPVNVSAIPSGVKITSNNSSDLPLYLKLENSSCTIFNELYQNFHLEEELKRGLNDTDSHVHPATFQLQLSKGQRITFVASTEENATASGNDLSERVKRDEAVVKKWLKTQKLKKNQVSDWMKQLVLASDQFVVSRVSQDDQNGRSVIAGYHWFEDWGRDTMISLTGLTLETGRFDDASKILKTFALYLNEGMLPNRFPDVSDTPEYNTIDATLWYFQAIHNYYEKTSDLALIKELYPKLQDVVHWHIQGTRYNIKMDPQDHLLSGGQDGVQLTWMDAKVGNHVVTPRMGKPVEVNALWYNAICVMDRFAQLLGDQESNYNTLADNIKQGFQRFWNDEKQYLFDVLDGPNGHEDLLRPNQLFTISLPDSPLNEEQQKKVVDVSAEHLLTSFGLRSLAPFEKEFIGFYGGGQFHRDSAYHQGTVWGWLLGPFVRAHLKVYQDKDRAYDLLMPISDHLNTSGLGTISEIFDGDAPFTPKGCIAQAWSVAQIIEAFHAIETLTTTSQSQHNLVSA
ncbi:amylo-alpha-1,6-glucosidase [Flammeovirga sp. OC4]|uniref:amylo-alpha-1,6-glucosidase n=1 Tax=Flammeovirga sp. OC4 TaxID=1382345 RepID=UPI0005C605E4|nr:amylo-alpha-1,6-glucosidase [Flammeovirga sp. OC4]